MSVSECLERCRLWPSLFCRRIMLLCAGGLEQVKSLCNNDKLTCQKFILHSTNAIYSWVIKHLYLVVRNLHFLISLHLLLHSSKDTFELAWYSHGGWRAFFILKDLILVKFIALYLTFMKHERRTGHNPGFIGGIKTRARAKHSSLTIFIYVFKYNCFMEIEKIHPILSSIVWEKRI